MNRNHSISGYGQSYHLDPSSLNFSMFSTSDIRQISVAKVITCSTFNAVGHAVPQGLYDPAMGPFSSRGDPCTTCAKTIDCTGHIGHIELANPVLNPMFIKPIYDVLRMSCLKCFKMQIRDQVQEIIILQLKLIDAGYLTEARELEYFKSELMIEKYKNNETSLLEEELKKANVLLASGPSHTNTTKNIESFRLTVIRSTFQIHNIGTGRKMCKFCNVKINPIKYLYRRLVMAVREEILDEEHNTKRRKSDIARVTNKFLLPEECQRYLRNIYANNAEFLKSVIPVLQNASQTAECPIDVFFMEVIPVSPPIVRPANKLRNEILEHPQTSVYQNIILANSVVQAIITKMQVENGTEVDSKIMEESTKVFESTSGSSAHEKLFNARQELQQCVDQLLDSNAGKQKAIGLKQIIEKKEGIIRKHMMGKRVNFAARTVITPDPNINVDEIGFPEVFAKRLTYPVPVTPWNVEELRKRIINGPDNFPGANFIEDEQGRIKMIPANNEKRRIGMVKLLSASSKDGVQIVHRHLQDGDVIIFNRQPSLHRPSMMGHKIKVLRNEKTFRLHYSNCKSYNADFDGDEMNAHVPQNELARSEGYNLANVANQYLVPKDGTPLGGLIQDHVIAGVKLSVRGRFFNKEDYCQLVFSALDQSRKNIKFLPPAIIKPHRLWSGKQVLSTIIINSFPDNRAGINLTAGTKISDKAWQSSPPRKWKAGGTILIGNAMTEAEVVFRGGELMSGVLDKTHFGATPYSLIHCVYDLYGSNCSTNLLSAFSKLFTYFLKREGFTLGVRDILVDSKADRTRTEIIEESRMIGRSVLTTALDMPPDTTWKNVKKKFDHALATDPKLPTIMDRAYKSALDNFTNRINRTCLPSGLLCKFPENNLQLMVGSGAKGSTVNTMQISCLLGQIELEGKRPPLMISGKSLPSFIRMETSPKSGGFIDGRFMTGIQPQDFFFHCMAGREGLIDTAVKTSRSGYLQRCLIKHLEGLNINYDMTVRDSDNSVVQFLYGEDGLDIAKSQFLKKSQLKFLDDNSKVILNDQLMDQIESIADEDEYNDVKKYKKKLKKWHKSNGPLVTKHYSAFQKFCSDLKGTVDVKKPLKLNKDTGRMRIDTKLIELWQSADKDQLKTYAKQCVRKPDPINSKYKSDVYFGSISEHMEAMVEEYLMKNPDKRKSFSEVVNLKGMSALAPPGEPVGLLAAQSVGEPSTQMTLNTFHFAGRGEMNVTLGIPRLREILMVASSNIKTPTMDIPFRPQTNLTKNAEKLRLKLNKITLANVLETINVKTRLLFQPNRLREYTIRFNFLPHEAYEQDYAINPKKIIRYMKSTFHNVLYKAVIKLTSERYSVVDIEAEGKTKNKNQDDDAELDTREPDGKKKSKSTQDDSDEDDEDDDNDATNIKLKNKRNDENEYDEPEEDDGYEEDKMEESYDQDGEKHSESESDVEIKEEEESNENASSNFVSDTKNYLWCQFTFHLDMRHKTVDLSTFLRQLAEKTILRQVPRINKAITYMQDDELILKTEGTNIVEMFPFNKELDLNRLYTNDIQAIARTYGIEAAARAIVKEIQNVFKVYGIAVDPRHLLLIADYMTFDGSVKPMNRKAMETAASPLQQMSFESSLQFLKSATINGCSDKLESPSSCLMFGQPCKFGTGAFSVLMDIQKLLPQSN